MSPFSAARVARFQRRWEWSLDTTCIVTHTPQVSDNAGGQVPGTPTTATYACRVIDRTSNPRERIVGGVVTAVSAWEIGLPSTAVVAPADTITTGGLVYQVDDTDLGRSVNYGVHAYCTKLGTG